MATESNNHRTPIEAQITHTQHHIKLPPWFCPETGVYTSKFRPVQLPSDPNLDVVSFIFSHPHNGTAALVDSSSGYFISYPHLFPLVKSVAFGLSHLGVSKGDAVLILLPNSIYFPVIALGILYVGAIIAPMNPLSSFSEVKKQTVDCHASWAFVTSAHLEMTEKLGIRAIEAPDSSISMSEIDPNSIFYKLLSTDHRNSSSFRPSKISQDDIGAYMLSSGTTGATKSVMISHRNLIAMVELFVRFEASLYDDEVSWRNVYLAALPMFHIYGFALFASGLLSLGTTVVYMRRFDVDKAVKAIRRFGVTHFPLAPPILRALTVKAKKMDGGYGTFRTLKQVSCGAAALTRKAIDEFVNAFPHVDFIQGYGMTESTAMGTRGLNTPTTRNYTSVGLLLPNTEAKVVDCITGSLLPPGNSGELWLKSPGTMQGYLNNREATALAIEQDGQWLHTGDLAYIGHDGYLYILDRIKDIIKYKGFQIAPSDLEAALITHPEVLDGAVTGAADEDAGEVPVAFVVRRPGSKLSAPDVLTYVAEQVAPYKKVRRVVFVSSLPKSPAGKVLRRHLRSSLLSSSSKI